MGVMPSGYTVRVWLRNGWPWLAMVERRQSEAASVWQTHSGCMTSYACTLRTVRSATNGSLQRRQSWWRCTILDCYDLHRGVGWGALSVSTSIATVAIVALLPVGCSHPPSGRAHVALASGCQHLLHHPTL